MFAGAVAVVLLMASLVTRPRPGNTVHGGALLSGAQVEPSIMEILDRSCLDCHSDATRYPWYSYVAPVSLLINEDVKRGRERLNLSRWHEYSPIRQQRALSEIANQIRDGGMPLEIYVLLHPSAKLSRSDADAVFKWTQAERLRLILKGNP